VGRILADERFDGFLTKFRDFRAEVSPRMLFSAKSKGFFVEQNDHTVLLARTSSPVAPLVVEALNECPVGDAAALTEALRQAPISTWRR
jgi:hypothetical protein